MKALWVLMPQCKIEHLQRKSIGNLAGNGTHNIRTMHAHRYIYCIYNERVP